MLEEVEMVMDLMTRRGTAIAPALARATARPCTPAPRAVDAPDGDIGVAMAGPFWCDGSPEGFEPFTVEGVSFTKLPTFPASLLMTWLEADLH